MLRTSALIFRAITWTLYNKCSTSHHPSTINFPQPLVDADGSSFGPGAGAFGTDGADTRAEVLRHGQSLEEMAGRAAGEGRGAVPERREGETSLRETGSQREATTILAVVRAGECFAQ